MDNMANRKRVVDFLQKKVDQLKPAIDTISVHLCSYYQQSLDDVQKQIPIDYKDVCPLCGFKIIKGYKFCPNCGQALIKKR
jgi:rubrerythrin